MPMKLASGILLSLFVASPGSTSGPKVEPEAWANLNYQNCFQQLLARPEESPGFRSTHDLVVTLRVVDGCRFERQLTLYTMPEGGARGQVIEVVGASIRGQLRELRKGSPNADLTSLCSSVRVDRKEIPPLAVISALLEELRALSLSPVIEPVIHLHGIRYTLWVTAVGNESYFDFSAPGADSPTAECRHPLDRWAQRVLWAAGLQCEPWE